MQVYRLCMTIRSSLFELRLCVDDYFLSLNGVNSPIKLFLTVSFYFKYIGHRAVDVKISKVLVRMTTLSTGFVVPTMYVLSEASQLRFNFTFTWIVTSSRNEFNFNFLPVHCLEQLHWINSISHFLYWTKCHKTALWIEGTISQRSRSSARDMRYHNAIHAGCSLCREWIRYEHCSIQLQYQITRTTILCDMSAVFMHVFKLYQPHTLGEASCILTFPIRTWMSTTYE